MKIYVASSWRNELQSEIVDKLRDAGHEVYDFRDPNGDGSDQGFHWSSIDPRWKEWTPEKFAEAIDHDIAARGFEKDIRAMQWADAFVLVNVSTSRGSPIRSYSIAPLIWTSSITPA